MRNNSKHAWMSGLSGRTALFALLIACNVGAGAQRAPNNVQPSVSDSFAAAREIATEARMIENRLGAVAKSVAAMQGSVAGIDASLKPVAALTQPEATTQLIDAALDNIMSRLVKLLLLALVCATVLVWAIAFAWRFARGPGKAG